MNLKHLILTGCIFFLFITCIHAQKVPRNPSRWSLSASAGAAIPVGKFAGKDFADSTQSLAKMGIALNIQLNYRICRHFGIALLLSGQDDHADTRSMEEQIANNNPGDRSVVRSGSWKIGKIMAGPTLSLPLGTTGKWDLSARVMAGVLRTAQPSLMVAIIASGVDAGGVPYYGGVNSTQPKVSLPWTSVVLGGIGLRYTINNQWALRLDVDYSEASVKAPPYSYNHRAELENLFGSFIAYSGPPPPYVPPPPSHFSIPVSSVNLTAGIELRF